MMTDGKRARCLVFTGGGTAGHVFPGLAVIAALEKDWHGRIVWIGSKGGMERELIAGSSYLYYGISCGKWRRYISLRNIIDIFKVLVGIFQALKILIHEKPVLLFSKGGYVSIPPVIAARLLGISVYAHESDYDPGLATRISSIFAERILVSFEETPHFFSKRLCQRILLTGNPVRADFRRGDPIRGRKTVRISGSISRGSRPIILILGGSRGSAGINALVAALVGRLLGRYDLIHQMGREGYLPSERPGYFTTDFFGDEMPDVLACADLVLSRSGAATLAELSAAGKAAILIPLPALASRGDQIRNADYFRAKGAALVFREETGTAEELLDIVDNLINNNSKLERMSRIMKSLGFPAAADHISRLIMERIG